jgi:hypothetical protein
MKACIRIQIKENSRIFLNARRAELTPALRPIYRLKLGLPAGDLKLSLSRRPLQLSGPWPVYIYAYRSPLDEEAVVT